MRDSVPHVEVVDVGVEEGAEEVDKEEQRDWDRFLRETVARLDGLEDVGADSVKVGTDADCSGLVPLVLGCR